ncbi:MAG: hypothetical protein JWO22_4173 [Frankiales bacterium]|nr:hypothetical protein [Frankiales bacterium]
MRIRTLPLAAAAVLVAMAVPSHAAGGSKTLFFANEGASGTSGCTPDYVLDKAPAGSPCSSIAVGAQGTGLLGADTFSSVKKSVGFKLNAGKALTGTVYLATYPVVSGTPLNTLPGPVTADITVTINGVEVGTVSGSGQAVAPNSDVTIPLSLSIPKKLNKAVVKSVDVTVSYKTAVGITGVDYSETNSSKLVFPTS